MGAVYEARQEPLDRRVALKTLHGEHAKDKEAVARFFNEAKVLSRLEHPSIVQVSDFGTTTDGTAYLVMEYLRGQSLARRIRDVAGRGERLPVATALELCVQVADVLVMAHKQGIVHRDLKPDNLMIVADPVAPSGERVKVLDFGIAKLTDESGQGGMKTATNQVMGTPAYMSPEQCAGAGGVDAQTDVYALGCVLYQLLAGRTPFVADGPGQLIGMHLFQEPTPLVSLAPKAPRRIVELVDRMLRKDKTQRPTMKEAASEFAKYLSIETGGNPATRNSSQGTTDGEHTKAIPAGFQSSTIGRSIGQRVKPPSRFKTKAVIVGLCAVVVGLLVWLWRGSPATETAVKVETKPRSTETSQTVAEVPDLGSGVAQKSEKVEESKEPKKSQDGEPPVKPTNKPAGKKRMRYEE